MLDFGGKKLNFVQIGLGTNSTFIQNLAGSAVEYNTGIEWLFQACSEHDPKRVLGIAVEPVTDLAQIFRPLASRLPGVQLLQAAMGEHDEFGVEMNGLTNQARNELVRQVPLSSRTGLATHLEYLRNMSCLGYVHPLLPWLQEAIEYDYGVKIAVSCNGKVEVWSWAKLVETFNFVGCEALVVDAEGYDSKILRSLLSYCRNHPEHWPELIQFETMGHCDRHEGIGTEKNCLEALQQEGYTLAQVSDFNSHVIFTTALDKEIRLQKWINTWYCNDCYRHWALPYVSDNKGAFCYECYNKLIVEGVSWPPRCTPSQWHDETEWFGEDVHWRHGCRKKQVWWFPLQRSGSLCLCARFPGRTGDENLRDSLIEISLQC